MGSLKIDVFNTSFTINASEDDEYLQRLLVYYKKIVDQIQKSGSLANPLHVSALAGIMLCDELYKEKSKIQLMQKTSKDNVSGTSAVLEKEDENLQKIEKITFNMIQKIDEVLK